MATGLRTRPARTEPPTAGRTNRVARKPGEVESNSGMTSSFIVAAVAMRGLAAPAEARGTGEARWSASTAALQASSTSVVQRMLAMPAVASVPATRFERGLSARRVAEGNSRPTKLGKNIR